MPVTVSFLPQESGNEGVALHVAEIGGIDQPILGDSFVGGARPGSRRLVVQFPEGKDHALARPDHLQACGELGPFQPPQVDALATDLAGVAHGLLAEQGLAGTALEFGEQLRRNHRGELGPVRFGMAGFDFAGNIFDDTPVVVEDAAVVVIARAEALPDIVLADRDVGGLDGVVLAPEVPVSLRLVDR